MRSFDDDYKPSTYGDRIAGLYDEFYDDPPPAEPTVALLAELAGTGLVLELGIGTGRIALPLQALGMDIHGIDASQRMVDVLRSKAGGTEIPVAIGDFADVDAPADAYSLVFVVWNTFYGLSSQEDQISCMENVAARLAPGGRFVISGFVPNLELYTRRQIVNVGRLGVDEMRANFATIDPVSQVVRANEVVVADGKAKVFPTRLRYCWPSELDLMARIAGLTLEHRWGGWDKLEFGSNSNLHVSVFRPPDKRWSAVEKS